MPINQALIRPNPLVVLGLSKELILLLKKRGPIKRMITLHYRELSKLYHPDNGGDAHRFAQLAEAYEELQDKSLLEFWVKSLFDTSDHLKELEAKLKEVYVERNQALSRLPVHMSAIASLPSVRIFGHRDLLTATKRRQAELGEYTKDEADSVIEQGYFDALIQDGYITVTSVKEVDARGGPKNLGYEQPMLGKDGFWWNRTLGETNKSRRVRYEPYETSITMPLLGFSRLGEFTQWITPASEHYLALYGNPKATINLIEGWPPEMVLPLIQSISAQPVPPSPVFGLRGNGAETRVVLIGTANCIEFFSAPTTKE